VLKIIPLMNMVYVLLGQMMAIQINYTSNAVPEDA
jgi:hypothetical protein